MQSTFDTAPQLFSGQGELLIGSRDVNGNPTGLRPVGNCSDLKINIATTVITHKNSQDGQRAIDARLQTETNPTVTFTIDSFIKENLAKALRGGFTVIPGADVSDEVLLAYPGLVTSLANMGISDLVLTAGANTLTAFTAPGTPWDYKENDNAGSVLFNDGSVDAVVNLGSVVTAITVGTTTVYTVPNNAKVGDTVTLKGVGGTDAAFFNGVEQTITAASPTGFTTSLNTTAKVVTVSGTTIAFPTNSPVSVSAAYTFAAYNLIDSLTQPLTDNYLRFEGLNTADANSPVVVEIFRFQNDPLKELALLSDTFAVMTIEGTLLLDSTRQTGSKYFAVRQLV